MSLHAYVDESARRNHYLICASTIAIQDRGAAQKVLRGLRSSGQRRIHFVDESDRRRRTILAAIAKLETNTVVYIAKNRTQVWQIHSLRPVRSRALEARMQSGRLVDEWQREPTPMFSLLGFSFSIRAFRSQNEA